MNAKTRVHRPTKDCAPRASGRRMMGASGPRMSNWRTLTTYSPMMRNRRAVRAFSPRMRERGPRMREHRPMSPDRGMANWSGGARRGRKTTMRPANRGDPYRRARVAGVACSVDPWRDGDVRRPGVGQLRGLRPSMGRPRMARMARMAYRSRSCRRQSVRGTARGPGSTACRRRVMSRMYGSNSWMSSGWLPGCSARFPGRVNGTNRARGPRRAVVRRLDHSRGRMSALAQFARS